MIFMWLDNLKKVEREEIQAHEKRGGSTPGQYALPPGAAELQDLIEHRGMNFARGNILKAVYRLGTCSHSDEIRDLNKIVWFANRELERLNKEGRK